MNDIRDGMMLGHRSDGRTVRRPLSPHLQVYRPQLTSVLSICNRMSGIVLSFGSLLLVWWLVAAASGPRAFAAVQWFAGSWIGVLLLFGWTVSLCYHFFGGLRHLLWDAGIGFDLPEVHRSGRLAVAATVVAVAVIWVCALVVRG